MQGELAADSLSEGEAAELQPGEALGFEPVQTKVQNPAVRNQEGMTQQSYKPQLEQLPNYPAPRPNRHNSSSLAGFIFKQQSILLKSVVLHVIPWLDLH